MLCHVSAALVLISAPARGADNAHPETVLERNDSFCPDGAYEPVWPEGRPWGLRAWGSYCEAGDKATGVATTTPFAAPRILSLYLAGYPSTDNVSLDLENMAEHAKLRIELRRTPKEEWLRYDFKLPRSWVGKQVRLVATDGSSTAGGWLGFSEPVPYRDEFRWNETLILLARTCTHFAVMMLLFFATSAFCLWKTSLSEISAGLAGLAAVAGSGYLAFWLWFFSPRVGHLYSFLLPFAAASALVWAIAKLDAQGRRALRSLATPAALMFGASLLVLATGFVYGGLRDALDTAGTRFTHALPGDNMLPFVLAEAVRYEHIPKPLAADWLSSDRPPLQTGLALAEYPFMPQPRDQGYQMLGALAQSLWIPALWLFLQSFRVDRRLMALIFCVSILSGFVFVNTFYVWPKLLAAAYTIGFSALILADQLRTEMERSLVLQLVAGSMAAFAALSHGTSFFALIGLTATALLMRKRLRWRSLAVLAVTAFVIYMPWLLYQKLYDPPGDRLLKYQLAGVEQPDRRPFPEVLTTAYEQAGFEKIAHNKWANFITLIGSEPSFCKNVYGLVAGPQRYLEAKTLRVLFFFFIVPNLGFLPVGLIALGAGLRKRYRSDTWRLAAMLALYTAFTWAACCLLLFGPGSTVIHQGSYATILFAYCACLLALWAVSPGLAAVIGACQIGLNACVYIVWPPDSALNGILMPGVLHYGNVFLAGLSLSAVLLLLERYAASPYPGSPARIRRNS